MTCIRSRAPTQGWVWLRTTPDTADAMTMKLALLAPVVAYAKWVLTMPLIGWGLLIGVIGLGPGGWVPYDQRAVPLCVLFGALAAAYPFSRILRRRPLMNWTIVAISCSPLLFGLFSIARSGILRIRDTSDVVGLVITCTVCLSLPIMSLVDLFLSNRLLRHP